MNKESIISKFLDYVRISSPSYREGHFAEILKKDMKKIGFEVVVDDAGNKAGSDTGNIIGYLSGNKDIEPIMFCAHMDTVTPCENIEPIIENGIIKSKANTILSADDKAGIIAILEGIKHIKENNIPHGDIEVVFTICEEVGLYGSKYLDYSKIKSKMAFVLDASGDIGGVNVQGPAQAQIHAKFHGKAAHAGLNPEKGINAIQVASRAIDRMALLRIDEETTANIGIIKGGSATNIVADYAEVEFEARSLNEEKLNKQVNHMVEAMEQAAKEFSSKVDIKVDNSYPTFKLDNNEPILKIIENAMKKVNIPYMPKPTGGGSDTNIFNGNGLKAATLGIGMFGAHSVDEYIAEDDIVKTAELVATIIENVYIQKHNN
ncbi:M20/M25/M40 family metallo-hydrolase [uncultured Tissierella sp.]|uniref:M20/M25/M40 family metallo-hydrolase n=1 Tax=uncultured Tissierella sp. TaxID=448160 RepID=UPI002803B488|nr:M20/M25/M40 family metallo-hydrolase [uncultured Tissierella sp.]MDU5080687.1 M20/M25/M40 family metallo-hydrolase [Bacillota bacterium]